MTVKKESHMVVKSNVLIDSRYKLTLSEMKLALLIISKVSLKDKDFKTYKIHMKDFIELLESKRSGMYTQSRDIIKSLLSKVLEIPTDYGCLQVAFLSSAKHFRNRGYVDVRFDPELKPYLIQLKQKYTRYDIANVLQCKSVYSVRMYEILKSFEGLSTRTIRVEDLRRMLACEDLYKRFFDFERGVIKTAKKELKQHSDIYFNYETTKQGRYITKITFKILKKKQRRLFDGSPYPSAEKALEDAKKVKTIPYDQWVSS